MLQLKFSKHSMNRIMNRFKYYNEWIQELVQQKLEPLGSPFKCDFYFQNQTN